MRIFPLILPVLSLAFACAHGQEPPVKQGSEQYKQVTALAANELKCSDPDKIDVEPVGESRVRVTGCKRSTFYVYACRQPGPRELEFVSNTPAPPSDEVIEVAGEGDTATDAPAKAIELRQQQIKYNEQLVASRLADVQGGAANGYLPRHKMPAMPKFWFDRECQYMHESEQ
jgi:hypothetical protein